MAAPSSKRLRPPAPALPPRPLACFYTIRNLVSGVLILPAAKTAVLARRRSANSRMGGVSFSIRNHSTEEASWFESYGPTSLPIHTVLNNHSPTTEEKLGSQISPPR